MFRNDDVSDGGLPILVEAPDDPVMSLADCKKALGITDSSQDNVLTAALAAVAANLDPASNGWLGRALRPQSWQLQLRSFHDVRPDRRRRGGGAYSYGGCGYGFSPSSQVLGAHAIPLPYPPLISVDSVKYLDVSGNDISLALGSGYRVLGAGATFGKQSIAPPYAGSWPVARLDEASVRIQFTCGYDDDVNIMPPQLTQAVALGVRALLPLMTRDFMLQLDRVEGINEKRYQNNPQIADIVEKAIGGLLSNLATA